MKSFGWDTTAIRSPEAILKSPPSSEHAATTFPDAVPAARTKHPFDSPLAIPIFQYSDDFSD